MPKHGIRADYDLMANNESAAKKDNVCDLCGTSPVVYQWSDYSGEAMCSQCGCPYQLKWGSDEQKVKAEYPYLNLTNEFLPVAKEYWEKTRQFVCLGHVLGHKEGVTAMVAWLKANHPEFLKG